MEGLESAPASVSLATEGMRSSMADIDLSVVIPVWNEAGNIGPLIDRQRTTLESLGIRAEWIVVDAGSQDNTVAEARQAGAWVEQQRDPGYGGALRLGFAHAVGKWVLTCDGDGSHDPEFLVDQLAFEQLEKQRIDVVVFSRYVPGGGADQPFYRRGLSWILNGFFRVLFRVPIRDQSSGYRLYRGDVIRGLSFESVNFDVLEEILVLLHRGGAGMKEVPFTFRDRQEGTSKVARDFFVFSYLRTVARLFQRSGRRQESESAVRGEKGRSTDQNREAAH